MHFILVRGLITLLKSLFLCVGPPHRFPLQRAVKICSPPARQGTPIPMKIYADLCVKPCARCSLEERLRSVSPSGEKGGCMDKKIKPIRLSVGWKDDTIYVIEYVTSDKAKETVYDKVKRLIMNEPITLEQDAS